MGTTNVSLEKQCAKTKCKACWILCPGLFIDHDQEATEQADPGWWGTNRGAWWARSTLDLEKGHTTLPYHAKLLHESLEAELSSINVLERTSDRDRPLTLLRIEELWGVILEQPLATPTIGSKSSRTESERSKAVDNLLPRAFRQVVSEPRNTTDWSSTTVVSPLERDTIYNADRKISPTATTEQDWDRLEVDCYKVLIASHLYSTGHEWVRWKVLDLSVKCWKGRSAKRLRTACDEMKALKWLYQMGISGAHAVRISVRENRR
jgi:hypothetical protein